MVERVWKEHMEAIMNKKNSWKRMVNLDMFEGPIEPFSMVKVEKAIGILNGKIEDQLESTKNT